MRGGLGDVRGGRFAIALIHVDAQVRQRVSKRGRDASHDRVPSNCPQNGGSAPVTVAGRFENHGIFGENIAERHAHGGGEGGGTL